MEQETVKQWLHRRSWGGNYFQFFRPIGLALGIMKATFLQDVINWGQVKTTQPDQWFELGQMELIRSLKWNKNIQTQYLKELERKKLIQVRLRNSAPPVRLIKINLLEIEEMIDRYEVENPIDYHPYSNTTKPGNQLSRKRDNQLSRILDDPYIEKEQDNKKRRATRDLRSEIAPSAEENQVGFVERYKGKTFGKPKNILNRHLAMAQQLCDAIRSTKQYVEFDKDKKQDWAIEIRQISTGKEKIPKKEVRNILDRFCKHIKQISWPVITTAKQFRQRFQDIKRTLDKNFPEKTSMSEKDEEILNSVMRRTSNKWPKNTTSKLPLLVQQTYKSFKRLHAKLTRHAESNPMEVKTKKSITTAKHPTSTVHYLLRKLPTPKTATILWFERWYEITQLETWNGNLSSWDGKPDGKNFYNLMGRYADNVSPKMIREVFHAIGMI